MDERGWLVRIRGAVGAAFRTWRRRAGGGASSFPAHNPYVVGEPVLDDRLFVGREPLAQRVLQTVHSNSVVLCGESRIGTTSLLHHLARRLVALDDPHFTFFPVMVDLETTPEERFFATLTEAVRTAVGKAQRPTSAAPEGSGLRPLVLELRNVVHSLSAGDRRQVRLVLLVDGVDRLNRFDPRTNQRLRSLFMKSLAEHLVCVAAGKAIQRGWDRAASPWYNFFEELEVPPLDDEAARTLMTRPVAGAFAFDPEVVRAAVARCRGRPEEIQRLGRDLVDRAIARHRRRIRVEDLEAVVKGERSALRGQR